PTAVFLQIMFLAQDEWPLLLVAMLPLLVSALTTLALAHYAGRVVALVSATSRGSEEAWRAFLAQLTETVFFMAASVVLGAVGTMVRTFLFSSASERVAAHIKTKLFRCLLAQDMALYDSVRVGEVARRLTDDTGLVRSALGTGTPEGLRSLSTAACGLLLMLAISPTLTVLALVVLVPVAVAVRHYSYAIRALARDAHAAAATAAAVAEEVLQGIRMVRCFSQEWEHNRFALLTRHCMHMGVTLAFRVGLLSGAVYAGAGLAVVVVFAYGAYLSAAGAMDTGDLACFILVAVTVGMSVANLSGIYGTMVRAMGAAERVLHMLNMHPRMPPHGNRCPPMGGEGP
ncbi:unnamed protein product, partial [Closterium sp. Naga37s-1]